MKNRFLIYTLLLLFVSPVAWAGEIDLQQVYRQLDEAIELTDRYVQEREERISSAKKALLAAQDEVGIPYFANGLGKGVGSGQRVGTGHRSVGEEDGLVGAKAYGFP